MKNNTGKIVLIIFLSLLSLGLIAILCIALTQPFDFSFNIGSISTKSDRVAYNEEFNLEDIQSIRLNVDAGSVKITDNESEDANKISLKIRNEENGKTEVAQNGGHIDVTAKSDRCVGFFVQCYTAVVEMEIPRSFAGDLSLDLDAGDVEIAKLLNTSIIIDVDAGKVSVEGAKNLELNSDASSSKIGSVESLTLKNDAGSVRIDECTGYLKINSEMGSVIIDKLSLKRNSSIDAEMGSIEINHAGDVRIDADVNMGQKEISGGNPSAETVLTIKNSMGNIRVSE